MVLKVQGLAQWIILISAVVGALGLIYSQVIRKLILGIQYLIDIGEFLQKEMQGTGDDSLKGKLNSLTTTVEGMDEAWAHHVAGHAEEHRKIWEALYKLGFDKGTHS